MSAQLLVFHTGVGIALHTLYMNWDQHISLGQVPSLHCQIYTLYGSLMLEQVPSLVWSKEGVAITYDRSNQAGLIPVLLDTEDNIGYMPYRSVLIFTAF